MKHILSFTNFINESTAEKDKKVNHIEDIEISDGSDKELESEIEEYIDSEGEYCPRCKELLDDCRCKTDDFWSTQTFHRVPKGKVIISKPKQEFKKDE